MLLELLDNSNCGNFFVWGIFSDVTKQAQFESTLLESVRLIVGNSEADILSKLNECQKVCREKVIDSQESLGDKSRTKWIESVGYSLAAYVYCFCFSCE